MNSVDDTIAAPASPPGSGLRAIVRVSGVETHEVVSTCFDPEDRNAWESSRTPRRHLGRLRLPAWRVPMPAAVMLWPRCRSYTGEPVAEIQVVGSPPLVDALLSCLYTAGARPARAGEFTLRAFLAGRLDLLQAEAVLGVIDAEDHTQLHTALDQLAGGVSGSIVELREQLLLHLSDLEAGLDFVDEDIEFVSRTELRRRVVDAVTRLRELSSQAEQRLHSTGRRQVVLAGLPNAGKSTLFNRLVDQDAAIVSARSGTTRDVLRADVTLAGVETTLWDTAGWEDAATPIDSAAADRRADRLDRADLVVWCTAADICSGDRLLDRTLRDRAGHRTDTVQVHTKIDLPSSLDDSDEGVGVSAANGHGLETLTSEIARRLQSASQHSGEWLATTAARCRESLRQAETSLSDAVAALDANAGDELIAVDLRAGLEALGMICGSVYTDDVLDRIFSRFCIGK